MRAVDFCARYPWPVIALAALVSVASAVYAARHFVISTDIEKLISPNLPWHQRQESFSSTFQKLGLLVVVRAPTPELADQATDALARRLSIGSNHIRSVSQPGGGDFFDRNALLYLPTEDLAQITRGLQQAEPLVATLANDPSLAGATQALSFALLTVQSGQSNLDDLARPLSMAADTLDDVLAGRPASFSWRFLLQGHPAAPREQRRFLEIDPILDYAGLEPGKAARAAITQAVTDLKLASNFQATVRTTGSVAMADDEFATVSKGAFFNATLTVLAVLAILWLALRSLRIIGAVFLTLIAGLAITSALGLMMVGALNPISAAFAVLFIGIGADFGIQFSVRYRSERREHDDLITALGSAAKKAGGPLALAATATAIGFLSFAPTAYRGLAELGEIAGTGMLVAFLTSITLLPALLSAFKPSSELRPVGFAALAPVDRFVERYRKPIIAITLLAIAAGLPLLPRLPFDFNPINLRDPRLESVAIFLELRTDPELGANSAEIIAPTLDHANAIAARLAKLPEVSRTTTIANVIPDDQDAKLRIVNDAAIALDHALTPEGGQSPPSDQMNVSATSFTAETLAQLAGKQEAPGANAARRLSALLSRLARAEPSKRAEAEAALISPLTFELGKLRTALHPQRVAVETIPPDIARAWLASDGRARVEVLPKGDPNDTRVLRNFATAVLTLEPSATGAAVSYLESGRTIVQAFFEAGALALLSIAVLLWIALKRLGDVLLTLIPLIVAGVSTLELCVLVDQPLNFANIIALPLLLGVGVAFKIYYIMAWRAGKTGLLQSTLTRAVIFSAMTTATAFGSLWLSNHPGTSSMGKLMALSLACTMAAAVFFQPVLMGPPRKSERS